MTNLTNGWDIEYWDSYLYQLKNGMVDFSNKNLKEEILITESILENAKTKYKIHKDNHAELFL